MLNCKALLAWAQIPVLDSELGTWDQHNARRRTFNSDQLSPKWSELDKLNQSLHKINPPVLFGIGTHLFYSQKWPQKHFPGTFKSAACFCQGWKQDLFHHPRIHPGLDQRFNPDCVRYAVKSVSTHSCSSSRAYKHTSEDQRNSVIPASPLYTDGKGFPPLLATAFCV